MCSTERDTCWFARYDNDKIGVRGQYISVRPNRQGPGGDLMYLKGGEKNRAYCDKNKALLFFIRLFARSLAHIAPDDGGDEQRKEHIAEE